MRSLLLPLALTTVACTPLGSTTEDGAAEHPRYGAEFQLYPAGAIGAFRLEHPISDEEVVSVRVGWNQTDREDFGRHDDESGGGYGGGLGYSRWLEPEQRGWFWGGQLDLWQLDVDWRRNPGVLGPPSGSSDVLVVQPALQAGYSVGTAGGGWRIDWTASLGVEINTDVEGEDIGEGGIFLLGVRLTAE